MRAFPTGLLAAVSLVLGFAVAEASGVRALGGGVLLLGLVGCWTLWRHRVGTGRAVGLATAYLAGFALSHPLADVVGAWPSVLAVAAGVGLLTWAVADRGAGSASAPGVAERRR